MCQASIVPVPLLFLSSELYERTASYLTFSRELSIATTLILISRWKSSKAHWSSLRSERLNSSTQRYKSPDEHPFFPQCLLEPILPPIQYPQVLHHCADSIYINKKVWNMYFRHLLPRLVNPGDDGNRGSAAVCDTMYLQLLQRESTSVNSLLRPSFVRIQLPTNLPSEKKTGHSCCDF